MAHLNNLTNEYQELLGKAFDAIPKSVLAAIVVSRLTCGGDLIGEIDVIAELMAEWQTLNENGIVPQTVPSKYRPQ